MTKVKDYLLVKDAADYLGVSPNTIRNWSRDGRLPVHRNPMNSYRLYRKSDLDRLLKSIRRSGPAGVPRSQGDD
jgi:excisionase family DNA binding protein